MKTFIKRTFQLVLGLAALSFFCLSMSETSDAFINLGCFVLFVISANGAASLDK